MVICRMLGLGGGVGMRGAFYGPGVGEVAFNNVECTGHEEVITDCPSDNSGRICGHEEDASVRCGR